MATQHQGGLISIIEKKEFMQNLPAGWQKEPKDRQRGANTIKNTADSEFTVLVHDKDFQGIDNCFEVFYLHNVNVKFLQDLEIPAF